MNKKNWKIIGLLILLTLPASIPLLKKGFYEPHDLHHFADIYQMARSIQSGQLPPRWAPDFLFGYGYPLFNFYYVLPFYLGALFFLSGFALTTSFKLVFLASIVLSVIGMYLFLREFFGKAASLAGSILFLYTPYKAVEIYVRGAMGEALALSILPFVLLIVVRLIKKPTKKLIAISSVIIAIFLLAHNYLWFLSLPYLGLLIFILLRKTKNIRKSVGALVVSGIFTLGMSAYWWMPAIFERKFIDRLTPFLLIDHFPFIKQLIIPCWGYGSSVWGPHDEISFQIGIVNLVVFGLVGLLFVFKRKLFNKSSKKIATWGLLGMFATLFMMNIRSLFLWRLVPFYDFIQFPWRLLIFTTLLTCALAAVLVETLEKNKFKYSSFLIVASSILLTFNYFKPSKITYKTDNEYLARFFANRTVEGTKPEVSNDYLQWSEDYLLLPNWVDEKPSELPISKAEIVEGEGEITKLEQGVYWTVFNTDILSEDAVVKINTLYFPGWKVFADNQELEVLIPEDEMWGRIHVEIPQGQQRIYAQLFNTPVRTAGNIVSLTSWLILFSYPLWRRRSSS